MDQSTRLRKNDKQFRALTGITPEKFDELLKQIIPLFREADHKRLSSAERKRAIGGGRRFRISLADRLLMVLIYYRTHVTHEFIGFLFMADDSTVSRRIRSIEPLLARIFRIPEKRIELSEDEIAEIFFDGIEQKAKEAQPKAFRLKGACGARDRKDEDMENRRGKIQKFTEKAHPDVQECGRTPEYDVCLKQD